MRLLPLLVASATAFSSPATWGFAPRSTQKTAPPRARSASSATRLYMGLDLVTYLRTEWVSAALCTNQTPRSADVCLQVGTEDGRAVTFIPRTIRELITSTAEKDGALSVSVRRQLKQQAERRRAAAITYSDQPADDLKDTKDESVDVVISLQAADRMRQNGLDWKRSVREAARVLKPGGRLLFVEQTNVDGESYLDYLDNLSSTSDEEEVASSEGGNDDDAQMELYPVFEEVGYDDVDLVLVPHVAGVAIKSMDAGLTPSERAAKADKEEQERLAQLSLSAFERGNKKRKKRKKKKKGMIEESAESA